MDSLYKQLKQFGRVKINASLAKFSNFHIGGPADFFVDVSETEKLISLLDYLSGEGIEYFILGGGSNVLFPDDGLRGAVIRLRTTDYGLQSNVIHVDSGVELSEFVRFSIENKLTGLEWAAGIPGTVGGAIRGNARAHYAFTGGEVKDIVQTITAWQDGEVLELTKQECAFGYRDSIFKHGTAVILGGKFELKPGDPRISLEMTQKIIVERQSKQDPRSSAGSFFKNLMLEAWPGDKKLLPERFLNYKKIAAGWLIEQVGLKGYQVGGALVSPAHGNFIINTGAATQADVLAVVEKVKSEVYNKFGIQLEEEVQIVNSVY